MKKRGPQLRGRLAILMGLGGLFFMATAQSPETPELRSSPGNLQTISPRSSPLISPLISPPYLPFWPQKTLQPREMGDPQDERGFYTT